MQDLIPLDYNNNESCGSYSNGANRKSSNNEVSFEGRKVRSE